MPRTRNRALAMTLLAMSLAAGPAGAEWQSMGASAEGELFVDVARLRKAPDGSVTFWQLETLTTSRKAPNGRTYAAISQHFSLRCDAGTYIARQRLYHARANGEGGAVFSMVPPGARWREPDGDSDMARWLPGMCYRASVLELFEKREQVSKERLDQMR